MGAPRKLQGYYIMPLQLLLFKPSPTQEADQEGRGMGCIELPLLTTITVLYDAGHLLGSGVFRLL